MRVCIEIETGLLRGEQSPPPATGFLAAQAARLFGGVAEDYEERDVTPAEHEALVAARDAAAMTLEQAKAAKTVEIRDAAEAALAPLGLEYGDTERATWDQQYAEAQAYHADPSASVSLLTAIATARGQAVDDLAAAIMSNRAAWVAISGHVVGRRLALQGQVEAAGTVADVMAVDVVITLPGG